jgi:hypothetical protein
MVLSIVRERQQNLLMQLQEVLSVDWLWWGKTDVSELRHLQAHCSSPCDLCCGPWVIILAGANSQLVYQSALASPQYCSAILSAEPLIILDLGARWGWVVSVTPRPRFSPGERIPGTHCTGGWVGLRAGLDTEAGGKILSPLPGIEPQSLGRPARSQTLYWLSYTAHQ